MSMLLHYLDQTATAVQYLADPVTGGPAAPAGAQEQANALYSIGKWVGYVVGGLMTLVAGVVMASNHQQGRPSEGGSKLGAIFAGVAVVSFGAAVVGTVTGF